VPGKVYATGDGDFIGNMEAGYFAGLADRFESFLKRAQRNARLQSNVGFQSLNEMIAAATAGTGKRRDFYYFKTVTATSAAACTFFYSDGSPAAGATPAAAPAGTTCSQTTTGSFPFNNPSSGEQYLVNGFYGVGAVGQPAMLCDRLFSVAKTMNTTAAESVNGVCTRYQSTVTTSDDYAGGNFITPEITTTLSATAHNHTVIQYTNQSGVTASIIPSIAGVSAAARFRIDLANNRWFLPLAAGDTGIQNVTQLQVSAAIATGQICYSIYHPLALFPALTSGGILPMDFVNSAFSMARILDNACLSFISPQSPATQTLYMTGMFRTVAT
jgi:hypothetical protein